MTLLFVYGTLMPGGARHDLLAPRVTHHEPAWTRGWLFALPGGYPGLLWPDVAEATWRPRVPPDRVHGALCRVRADAALWSALDAYEGCVDNDPARSLYLRLEGPVEGAQSGPTTAWLYTWNPARADALRRRGERLPSGRFRGEGA